MAELTIEAKRENLDTVIDFVNEKLSEYGCSFEIESKIDIAVEEIFVNIVSYAYDLEGGDVTLKCNIIEYPLQVELIFGDLGIPYNPLERPEPDINKSAEEREIGGLGILLTKKLMDDVSYEYKDGKNILKIKKKIGGKE